LARHFREAEGLSIEKVRAVKARYVGVCRGCGAYTQSPNRTGDA
jgi:Fe-S cluster biogenesis protein NfuA